MPVKFPPGKYRLRDQFAWTPPSERICELLQQYDSKECGHHRNPCILRCGVRRLYGSVWQVIPLAERVAWLDDLDPEKED